MPALALFLLAGALGTGPATAATGPPTPKPTVAEEEFWTAERMAEAVPVDAARDRAPSMASARAAGPRVAPPGTKKGEYFGGLPMVGTFFYKARPFGGKATSP